MTGLGGLMVGAVLMAGAPAGSLHGRPAPARPEAAVQESLAEVARRAQAALESGDLSALVATGDRIRLSLPGVEPSAPVGPAQAAAALRGALGAGGRVEVGQVREVGRGEGFVELLRAAPGAGPTPRRQQILLRYRQAGGGWRLVEIRAN